MSWEKHIVGVSEWTVLVMVMIYFIIHSFKKYKKSPYGKTQVKILFISVSNKFESYSKAFKVFLLVSCSTMRFLSTNSSCYVKFPVHILKQFLQIQQSCEYLTDCQNEPIYRIFWHSHPFLMWEGNPYLNYLRILGHLGNCIFNKL